MFAHILEHIPTWIRFCIRHLLHSFFSLRLYTAGLPLKTLSSGDAKPRH